MRRFLSRVAVVAGAAVVVLAGVVAVQTARFDSTELPVVPAAPVAVSPDAARRLAGAIRFRTISAEDPSAFDGVAFTSLHAYLQHVFPRAHRQLRREVVASNSLLYEWRGEDVSLPGILFAGHLDVVPVEGSTEAEWSHAPFEGRIADGFIWGRGAIDNKSAVMGTLEAVEMLIAEGFAPRRTIYFAFGHDEEVGGTQGAQRIAALLKERGVELEVVLDEGGVVGEGVLPGLTEPVALVGIAEKGFASIELTTRVAGGHSSLPPRATAVGILAAAVSKLEQAPMPARVEGAARALFDQVGPRLPWMERTMFANLWLTRPLVSMALERSPATNAMIRTTGAPTIFQAGTKDNVLPDSARAVVNFRILPGDSIADVVAHVKHVIADDRIEVKIGGRFTAEPSTMSRPDSAAYRTISRSIRHVFPDAVVAPFLVVVATDARYYSGISRQVFRFLPLRLSSGDLSRMHGINERIGIREYEDAIRTYRTLLVDLAGV